MGQLAKLVRFCFGLEALSLIAGIPIFLITAFKLSLGLGWRQASSSLFLITELMALGALVLDVVPAISWWMLKKGNRHARAWALAASVANLIPLPSGLRPYFMLARMTHLPGALVGALIGAAGLIAFSRPQAASTVADTNKPKPERLPGDGTSKATERIAIVLAIAWLFFCLHWWRVWARAQQLSESDFLVWIVEIQIAVLVCVAIHELGHVIAGWASYMKLRSLEIGPFRWAHKRGKWKFKLVPRLGGGVTGMAPTRLANVRGCSAFFTLGGPVASLVLAGVACIAALTAKGHFWQGAWSLLSLVATIASVDFVVNLIPQKPETNYSDGARIYQLVTNGPWAHVEQAFSMVASTLVTSRRPRDFDVEVIRAAGNFLVRGDRGMLLRLYSCMHHLDTGEVPQAIVSLEEAERLYEGTAVQSPAGICAVFVFMNAIFKRDQAAAELWWQRLQAQRNIDFDAEYWQARAGLLWIQGQGDEARSACEHGYALALKLPAGGAYDYTRSGFDAVRNALDEPSPGLGEMLTAINSDEAEAEAAEAEAPAFTDPVL
ncbi:MAG TPA: M50 family metallopeptidase [Bryobacteraceae bacterium]|nr:M50 family metallopeptidase [Bryobacteraceae bacterium]